MSSRPPMPQNHLQRILGRAIAFPIVLMAVLAIVLLLQISRLISLTKWVDDTDQVIASAHTAQRLLLERVAGLRGYLLTGIPEDLKSFTRAASPMKASLSELSASLARDRTQAQRAADMQAHYAQWNAAAARAILLRRSGGDVAAYAVEGDGQRELEAVSDDLSAIVAWQELLRGGRTKEVRTATARIAWSGVVLTILLGGLLAFVSRGQLLEATRSYRKALEVAELRAAALQESEARFRSLGESSVIGVVSIDLRGTLLDANDAFLRLVGYKREDIAAGLPWIDLIPPEFRDKRDAAVAEFRAAGVWTPVMQELVRKDGRRVSVWLGGTLVEGYSDRALCFAIDTTERRRAEDSLRFLADASTLLGSTLDYGPSLRRAAHLAVPSVADWCVIDVLDDAGKLQRVAAAHVDPTKEELALDLSRRYPPAPGEADPLVALVRAGKSEFYPLVPDSLLAAAARNDDHLAMLRELGFASYICVPLIARGRTLGAITMVMGESGRAFDEQDLSLAEDLARRVAVAIDNSRLYRDVEQELAVRRQTEAALEKHRAEIETLNDQLRRAMTETHHRVKNNLQIIAAMVDMRLMDHKEMIPAEEFRRLGSVVSTLAAVHQILTQEAKDDGQAHYVSAAEILEKLIPLLQRTAGSHQISLQVQDVRLSARQGTSLALVANELVSNAVKYGKRRVDVALCVDEEKAVLEVLDDGPGYPPGFDAIRESSTGLELVERLSRWDLAGKPQYENRPASSGGGAYASVTFPLQPCADPER